MIDFFKPDDFSKITNITNALMEHITLISNAKLEREGKIVYASRDFKEITLNKQDEKNHIAISSNFKNSAYQALLIDIKEIKKCDHPSESIVWSRGDINSTYPERIIEFRCDCGAKVKPTQFKALDE